MLFPAISLWQRPHHQAHSFHLFTVSFVCDANTMVGHPHSYYVSSENTFE